MDKSCGSERGLTEGLWTCVEVGTDNAEFSMVDDDGWGFG